MYDNLNSAHKSIKTVNNNLANNVNNRRRLLGAGKGRAGDSKVQNKGTGGKSKLLRGPLPPVGFVPIVEHDDPVEGNVGDVEGGDEPFGGDDFIVAKPPKCRKTFSECSFQNKTRFNQFGYGYCGLAAINTAIELHWDLSKYQKHTGHAADPVQVFGDSEYLTRYAASLGHNLAVFTEGGELAVHHEASESFEWILLYFTQPGEGDDYGHYELLVENLADKPLVRTFRFPNHYAAATEPLLDIIQTAIGPTFMMILLYSACLGCMSSVDSHSSCEEANFMLTSDDQHLLVECAYTYSLVCPGWVSMAFLGFLNILIKLLWAVVWEAKYTVLATVTARTNKDVRTIVCQREELKSQDEYITVKIGEAPFLSGYDLSWLNSLWGFMCERTYQVSSVRLTHVYNEMQLLHLNGKDPLAAVADLNRLREVNTDVAMSHVLTHTGEVAKLLAAGLGKVALPTERDRTLIGFDTDGHAAFIPEVAFNNVRLHGGREKFADKKNWNHVSKWRRGDRHKPKRICVAPIGAVTHHGLFSSNDEQSTLSAFVGRAMAKEEYPSLVHLDEFLAFSTSFLDDVIEKTEISPGHEPEPSAAYVDHYRGKKKAEVINNNVAEYDKYMRGEMSTRELKKFTRHSAFVKCENNTKMHKGEAYVRPRLIMTLSKLYSFMLVPLVALMQAWAHGPFSKYQVKGMTTQEMLDKIVSVSNRPHCVTDMSAFESSITKSVRQLENHVMVRLCEKAGYFRTKAYLLNLASDGRFLHVPWGVLWIVTRCSGDFWTSFGNGIVNVCLNAYCAHKKGLEFSMIAEGDDGLISSEIPCTDILHDLGFKFSSEIKGEREAQCDFLRSLWSLEGRILNVPRCMQSLWLKKACYLRKSKQLFLLRCVGQSLHHLSPGHPILWALVERIGMETSGASSFKNHTDYLDMWKYLPNMGKYPVGIAINERLRPLLAVGTHGFPPISICDQLVLEDRLLNDKDIFLGRLLDDYPEMLASQACKEKLNVDGQMMDKLYSLMKEYKMGL